MDSASRSSPPPPSATPSLKRRLLQGGAWVLAGKAFTALAGLLLPALLAEHLLTREQFGAYGMAFRLVTVAAVAALFGLHQAVVRLVAESRGTGRPGRARAAIRRVYRYAAVGVLVTGAVLAGGGGAWLARELWESPVLAGAMGLIAVWAMIQALQNLNSETFRGFQDLRLAATFGGVISGLLSLTFVVVWWRLRGTATLRQIIVLIVIAGALSVVSGLVVLYRRTRRLSPPESLPRRDVLSISVPLWVNALTTIAMMQCDVLILGAFLPHAEVAIYFAAAHLVAMVSQPLTLVNLVVPPFIAELYALGQKKRLERILRNAATLAGGPALVVLLGFLFFGGPILAVVYGDEYRAGAAVLALLSLGKVVNVFTGSCGVTMSMTGHQTVLMRITIFTGALTVAVMLAVVRPYGAIGVASTVSGGVVLQNLLMWLATRYYTGMWTHAGIPRIGDVRALLRRGGG